MYDLYSAGMIANGQNRVIGLDKRGNDCFYQVILLAWICKNRNLDLPKKGVS